jgi:P4 family phage/plasmid primase-like protien
MDTEYGNGNLPKIPSDNSIEVKEFIKFMLKHKIDREKNPDAIITHTSMGPLVKNTKGMGSFSIDGIDYEIFMNLYKQVLGRIDLYIVERPKQIGPFIIDIDFNTAKEYKERQYLTKHIELIVNKFNDKIMKYLDIELNDVVAFVEEKPEPTFEEKKGLCKDGFHIVYPEVILDYKLKYFILDIVREEVENENGLEGIPLINQYKKIFDKSVVIDNGVLMFGSRKPEFGRKPYQVTHIYKHDMTEIDINEFDDDEFVSILSLRGQTEEDEVKLKDNYINNTETIKRIQIANDELGGGNKKRTVSEDEIMIRPKKVNEVKPSQQGDIKMAKMLVPLLSSERATDFGSWICVGWALHNIHNSLMQSFIDFSKKCPEKYDESYCRKVWNDAKDYGYTIASLHWWAKKDNPVGYLEILREHVKLLVEKAESGSHDDIANIVFEMYKNIYKCVNITKNVWFGFKGSKWCNIDSAYTLSEKISDEITSIFLAAHADYLKIAASKERIDRENCMKRGQVMINIYNKLKMIPFKKHVLSACAIKFYDSEFVKRLDENKDLLGFNNGVYDLRSGCFRDGSPDDYISMSTGYDYIEFKGDEPVINEISDFFNKVQPDEAMQNYVLKTISTYLDGYNKEEKFSIWTGSGCHEKNAQIIMYDNSIKKIQDVKVHENVLGDDGRERRVLGIFHNHDTMYKVTTNDNVIFRVTGEHRLALRSCHISKIIKTHDDIYDKDIYWISYYNYLDGVPIRINKQFNDYDSANEFLFHVANIHDVIQYGEVVPIKVSNVMDIIKNDIDIIQRPFDNEPVMNHFKLYRKNTSISADQKFVLEMQNDEEYFGIEIDGNKRYVMDNNFVTYNSNGKSKTVDLINVTLGDYAGTIGATFLTRKQGDVNSATPELADTKGKRFIVMNEPEGTDTLFVGKMKEITGGDTLKARKLYCDPFPFKPQFKIILLCNDLPHIPSSDMGTWRRLLVILFESRFVENPEKPNEFVVDKTISEKLKNWNQAFMWILLTKYYPEYRKNGIQVPEKVKLYTSKYQMDTDYYCEFIRTYYEETSGKENEVDIDNMYNMFQTWYKNMYGSIKHPTRKELCVYLNGHGHTINGDVATGLVLRPKADEK